MANNSNFENYILDQLKPIDSIQLHKLISDNKERLKLYFPVTLEKNSSLEMTEAYISVKNKEMDEKTNFTLAIRDKDNQQIAGLIIIKKIDLEIEQGEFAYFIGSEFEGKGLVSFAVKEMTNFAFKELGLKTLQIVAHKTNLGSVKVAKKNGFTWQKTIEKEFTPTNGSPLDMELYELKNEK